MCAGKTASLKALGLAAVMAKAGLFLPLEPDSATEPRLLWFDKVCTTEPFPLIASALLSARSCTMY